MSSLGQLLQSATCKRSIPLQNNAGSAYRHKRLHAKHIYKFIYSAHITTHKGPTCIYAYRNNCCTNLSLLNLSAATLQQQSGVCGVYKIEWEQGWGSSRRGGGRMHLAVLSLVVRVLGLLGGFLLGTG